MMSNKNPASHPIRVRLAVALFVGLDIFGCAGHGVSTYVRNDSKLTVLFQITGLGNPWRSQPVAPGGKVRVDREFSGKADNVHLSVSDVSTGKTLIIEHLGNDFDKSKSNSNERVISYPPSL